MLAERSSLVNFVKHARTDSDGSEFVCKHTASKLCVGHLHQHRRGKHPEDCGEMDQPAMNVCSNVALPDPLDLMRLATSSIHMFSVKASTVEPTKRRAKPMTIVISLPTLVSGSTAPSQKPVPGSKDLKETHKLAQRQVLRQWLHRPLRIAAQ